MESKFLIVNDKEINGGKKICLIIHSLGIGGMERVMSKLATNFAQREKIEIHLILIGGKREIRYPIGESIKVHRPSFEFNNSKRIRHTFKTINFLRSKLKIIKPEAVLSFGEMWNNLVLLSVYKLNFPIYISDRSEPGKDLGRFQNYLRDKLYPTAAGYIAQTKQAKKVCLQKKWNRNIRIIGNPVRQVTAMKDIERENIVLFVGRLIKTKHVDQLIRMFNEVREPGWKLQVVGGDAKRLHLSKEYQKLIDKLQANDYISLEGEQQQVEKYYNKSNIFAFPSSSEGFPNVIGEALSAGLPVIAYNSVAGISDLISNGKNGFLIPLHDKRTFKERMKGLMEEKKLREKMSDEAKKIVNNFKVGEIADKFYNFIIDDCKEYGYKNSWR